MANTARPTSTDSLTKLVNLAAHGFSVGQALIFDGAWVLAQADSLANCAGTWIVSIKPDADSFYVTQQGWVNGLPAIGGGDVGVQFYLDPANLGVFTKVRPTTVGNVILPCLVYDTTTTGFFYGGSGDIIEASTLFAWTTTTTTPINLAANNGYFANGVGATTYVLPANYEEGDEFIICDHSGNGFVITQTLGGVNQRVFDLNLASTAGAAGTTTTTLAGQAITLVAVETDGALRVVDNKGAFTYA